MSDDGMNLALRIYRRLAQAFPHEFKLAYGPEVMQLGEDVVEEMAKRHGVAGLIRLIVDIAIRVPLEYLSEMRGDMRYGWRALLKSPGFALVGIISMGLGIGLTTNVYSSKWEMLFRELPAAANAKHLVMLQASADGDLAPESYYYVEQYREQKSLFTGVAAFKTSVPFNVTFQGDLNAKPERVFGQIVSPDYFSVLGVQPQQGRVLSSRTRQAWRRARRGDQRSFLAQSPQLFSQRRRPNPSPQRANRHHRGNHAEEFQWRSGRESLGAVRSNHRAGRARSGTCQRRAASTLRPGIPAHPVPRARRHD